MPDDRKIAEVGWNRSRMATIVRAMGDGAFLGEYFDGTRRYNVVMRAENWYSPEELAALPVATARGDVVSLGELSQVVRTANNSGLIERGDSLVIIAGVPFGFGGQTNFLKLHVAGELGELGQ